MGFAASLMSSIGSMSMGPGTFLIVNAIAISRTLTIFNFYMDKALYDQLNKQLDFLNTDLDYFSIITYKVFKK